MSPTVIIGAGPAGLTAAYELSKNGISSTILEADEIVGGISRTANSISVDIVSLRRFRM